MTLTIVSIFYKAFLFIQILILLQLLLFHLLIFIVRLLLLQNHFGCVTCDILRRWVLICELIIIGTAVGIHVNAVPDIIWYMQVLAHLLVIKDIQRFHATTKRLSVAFILQ